MSAKSNREDWNWVSLFDPKTGHTIPAIEGGFEEVYQVEEEYIELNDEEPAEEEDDDEYTDYTEEDSTLSVFDDVDDDEE